MFETMQAEKEADQGIEIEANYYLMQVFNAINEQKTSPVFVFKGAKFWRENYEFVTEQHGKKMQLGEIVDFDEFKAVLGI
jgi:hypothetical protein